MTRYFHTVLATWLLPKAKAAVRVAVVFRNSGLRSVIKAESRHCLNNLPTDVVERSLVRSLFKVLLVEENSPGSRFAPSFTLVLLWLPSLLPQLSICSQCGNHE